MIYIYRVYPYYPCYLLLLLLPLLPLFPLLPQREVHVSMVCVFSMYGVGIVYGIDVFLRACIGAWIVFFLDVS